MSTGPEGQRVVRQLRHDVDDVYELLSEQGDRLETIEGRLERIEGTQQEMLTLLREIRGR